MPSSRPERPGLVAAGVDGGPIEGPFRVGELEILPFRQQHGRGDSWGFRVGRFAYSTDTDGLDEAALTASQGLDVWLVDALRERPHPSHAHLELTLGWIDRVRPAPGVLTHMNHELDYADWASAPAQAGVAARATTGWSSKWRIEGRVAGAATLVYARRMATIAVDTLRLARGLEAAGFPTSQAQGAAEAIADAITEGVATRSDLREVELRLSRRYSGDPPRPREADRARPGSA